MQFEFTKQGLTHAMEKIADHMLTLRPRAEVTYRPYRKSPIYYEKHLDLFTIDLKKLYPEAKAGDGVYIGTHLLASNTTEAKINFIGNAKILYRGEVIFDSEESTDADGKCRCALPLCEGENPVLFYVRCRSDEEFTFRFMPSVRWYWIWAKCYLLSARATSPLDCYRLEDGVGISRLYHKEEPFDGVFVYPQPPADVKNVNFSSIFEGETGDFAYALTYALSDTELAFDTDASLSIFVNSERRSTPCALKKGDTVLVKAPASASFQCSGEVGIPFVHSYREGGDQWLTVGPFESKEENVTPEDRIDFKKPYRAGSTARFWRLMTKNDYLRPYLLSRFFGQWHYTFMVGSYGLLNASKTLSNATYLSYFQDHMRIMVDYFDYMRYEHEHFSSPSFLDISSTLHDLDSIGSIGRNLSEFYEMQPSKDTLHVLDTLLSAMETNIPRFEDGVFHRERDMWADDTFMSCPFLVRAARIKREPRYAKEAIHQLLGFRDRLWIEDEELFSHIFFLDDAKKNSIPWGRGNGWVLVSMSDVLANAPKSTPRYDELTQAFQAFARGIVKCQDASGLWHQVLNRPDSYSETSCTALFAIALCRGIRLGILPEEYKKNIMHACEAILREKVDDTFSVRDVCMGSGNAREAEYYMALGTVQDDDHGTGVILTMLSEVVSLFWE